MTDHSTCPHCNSNQNGEPISEEYLKKGFYGEWDGTPKYYSRTIGVEISEVYDGVLYWMCPDCGGSWHRWEDPEMKTRAEKYMK